MMTATQKLDHFRKVLHALRGNLDNRSSALRAEASHGAGGDSAGELSHMPSHMADVSNQETEAAVNVELAANEAHLRREIDDALERLENGGFGICEECKSPIGNERLEALPYSRWCIQCAEKNQKEMRSAFAAG
jgi:DnaK suppressor protein